MKKNLALIGIVLLFCSLGILIYSNTFHSSFHFDDEFAIINNPAIRSIHNLIGVWRYYPTRLVAFFTFALNYHLSKLDTFTYHVFNLVIHLGSAILVWMLTGIILSIPRIKKTSIAKYSKHIAFFTALIFLSHPVQTQAVTFIWQRCASLGGFFYLLSLYLYIKTRLLQIDNKSVARWSLSYGLSYLFCVLAMFTKENSLSLPFMIIMCEAYFFKMDNRPGWRYALYFLLTLIIIPWVLFFTNLRPNVMMDLTKYTTLPLNEGGRYFLTQFRVILTYVRLLFLPLNQNMDYDYPWSNGLMSIETLGSLLILVFIIIMAIRLSKKCQLASFGIFWFFLTLLPESSIMPFKDVIFEYRLYLPVVGYGLFLTGGLYYVFHERGVKFTAVVLSLLIILYSMMTYDRNKVWKDELTLWTDTLKKSPHKARPYYVLGCVYQHKGEFDKALAYYNKATEVNPNQADAYNNRATFFHAAGKIDEAIYNYTRALEISPDLAEVYLNRGDAYQDKGLLDEALADYTRGVQIDPYYAEAYSNRGNVYQTKGDLKRAILDYEQALMIDPNLVAAYNSMGCLYQETGDSDKAFLYYNKAIKIDPYYAEAYTNRGTVYQDRGELEKALSDYNKAIELVPDLASAYNNRALIYFLKHEYGKSWGDMQKAEFMGYKVNPDFIAELRSKILELTNQN